MNSANAGSFASPRRYTTDQCAMPRPIITFTTDFGSGSPYVAEMKGVALSICPEAHLIDISHAVPAQDIRCGAIYLDQAARSFPPGSIHVAVVDPGVGTERRIVLARSQGRVFVAPDNGLLTRVAKSAGLELVVEANQDRYWNKDVSSTFHGRDIMTPLAAHVANGVAIEALGGPCEGLTELAFPEAQTTPSGLRGEVVAVDTFGNLVTNVNASHLSGHRVSSVRCGSASLAGLVRAYAEKERGELVALVGSSGWVEIAEVNGNAAGRLRAGVGEAIYLEFL
jgi:S-adenosyl-L-methionine hydrolase (adenosine-forming)